MLIRQAALSAPRWHVHAATKQQPWKKRDKKEKRVVDLFSQLSGDLLPILEAFFTVGGFECAQTLSCSIHYHTYTNRGRLLPKGLAVNQD